MKNAVIGDVSFLARKTLQQVCVGQYSITFFFGADSEISVEGRITFFSAGAQAGIEVESDYRRLPPQFLQLISAEVASTEVLPSASLRLWFTDGRSIVIHNNNEEYESFQIAGPNGVTIV